MHAKCESEGHTNNNRPTGKIPQRHFTEKATVEKTKFLMTVLPTLLLLIPSLMKLKTRTQIKLFHCQYADSAA